MANSNTIVELCISQQNLMKKMVKLSENAAFKIMTELGVKIKLSLRMDMFILRETKSFFKKRARIRMMPQLTSPTLNAKLTTESGLTKT